MSKTGTFHVISGLNRDFPIFYRFWPIGVTTFKKSGTDSLMFRGALPEEGHHSKGTHAAKCTSSEIQRLIKKIYNRSAQGVTATPCSGDFPVQRLGRQGSVGGIFLYYGGAWL